MSCLRQAQLGVFTLPEWWNVKLTLPPFSFLRWPCCDGAKCPEEHRQLRSTAGFPLTCLYHDPSLTIPDATLRLPTITETLQIQCWSLGPWTLRDFLYRFFIQACSILSACVWVCVCDVWCVMCLFAWMWSVDRSKEEDLRDIFFLLYYKDRFLIFDHLRCTFFSAMMNKTGSKLINAAYGFTSDVKRQEEQTTFSLIMCFFSFGTDGHCVPDHTLSMSSFFLFM